MSSIILDARAILESSGYRTVAPTVANNLLYFEDESVIGVCHAVETVQDLMRDWQMLQDRFIRENTQRLLLDSLKAWNCYSVYLASEPCAPAHLTKLYAIEEDFRSTRKIVRAGVVGRADVEAGLAPLLPLRRILSLASDDVNGRLAERLGGTGSPLRALLSTVDVAGIAATLVDGQ